MKPVLVYVYIEAFKLIVLYVTPKCQAKTVFKTHYHIISLAAVMIDTWIFFLKRKSKTTAFKGF